MKNKIVIAAIFCLLLAVGAVLAQDKTKAFVGDWELDLEKSKLSERLKIESMTMKVSQTVTDLTVETKAERSESDITNQPMGRRGGFGGRRGMLRPSGNQNTVYKLNGEETKIGIAGPVNGETTFKLESLEDGKLKLVQSRTLETPRGEMTITITETWELQDEGKTLKITRETKAPRGDRESEMVFVRK